MRNLNNKNELLTKQQIEIFVKKEEIRKQLENFSSWLFLCVSIFCIAFCIGLLFGASEAFKIAKYMNEAQAFFNK